MELKDHRIHGNCKPLSVCSASDYVTQAHALILVLEQAWRTDWEVDRKGHPIDTIRDTNSHIIADAMDGVATLLELAQYKIDEAAAEEHGPCVAVTL